MSCAKTVLPGLIIRSGREGAIGCNLQERRSNRCGSNCTVSLLSVVSDSFPPSAQRDTIDAVVEVQGLTLPLTTVSPPSVSRGSDASRFFSTPNLME